MADGVGGWSAHNVNPAMYSRKLCTHIEGITKTDPRGYLKKAKELIHQAWSNNHEKGTSTLVVVTLPFEGNVMHTSWVGDSSYCILRVYENADYVVSVVHTSKAQQKGFNYPYQLGWQHGDHPDVAKTDKHELQEGDIVVVGSDGVFDNLTPEQIAEVIQKQLQASRGRFDPNMIAKAIADEAFRFSLDDRYNSPFSKEAAKYQIKYQGGKSDDIAVSLGQVRLASYKGTPDSGSEDSQGSKSTSSTADGSASTPSQDHTSL